MSDEIVNRLRCRYASGPIINGEPEFGWRDFGGPVEKLMLPTPIMKEAADEIERLRAEAAGLRECAIDLWMMLDDIDTGGDRAKADDVLYRAIAERTHRRRFSPKYQIVIDAIDAARKGEA